MNFLSALKVSAIKLTDKLNTVNDPFQEFARPPIPSDVFPAALSARAADFEADLLKDFLLRDGTIINYRIPLDNRLPLDLGDQALWHGIYTATFAFKYFVTKDPATDNVIEACIQGLSDQQPGAMLIRGIDESGNRAYDASNDQATGHLAGLFFTWLYGPERLKSRCAELMNNWATSVLGNGHALANPNGRITTYGQLINGWKTDPLRLTLCLAIYGAACQMTGSRTYLQAYNELMHTYGDLAIYPKVRLWWLDTAYDTHRAAIHLAVIQNISLEFPGRLACRRLRLMVAKQGNIWVNALCALADVQHEDDTRLALKVLSEFNGTTPIYNPGVDLTDSDIARQCGGQTIWNGEWVSRQPVPRWAAANQDFIWQRNLYALQFRQKGAPPDSRYNGGAYLAAYWLCRRVGIL